jgi:dTDP-4-dehydrorhamnose 3,5-epimerase
MRFKETPLKGAYIIELEPHTDNRGTFVRLYCKDEFSAINHRKEFVQINYSITNRKGAVRGMHYQVPPSAETKLIGCVNGRVFDVIVDIRKKSSTFLKWFAVELSKQGMKMIYIPEGFAHGFQTLEDGVELIYHHTSYYNPAHERTIRYDDKRINIAWPLNIAEVSDKDRHAKSLDIDFTGIEL